jgi:ubiquinone/menaquinone biosynthesis C-methylase UbiE
MRSLAIKRGIETMDGLAEKLPYADMRFDFVAMIFCIAYFKNLSVPFKEAFRVLKSNGELIVGFIDRNSIIGKNYEARKNESIFYRHAKFYSVDKVVKELTNAGFRHFTFNQTLFGDIDEVTTFQPAKEGYGEGSFIVIKASKKLPRTENP